LIDPIGTGASFDDLVQLDQRAFPNVFAKADSRVLWIVKPEPKMKGVGRCQSYVRVEAEDLVEEDGLDANVAVIATLADLDV
jgi:hypothetical protein